MERSSQNEVISPAMEIVDKVFVVIFARYRRKIGDSDIKTAWRGASNKVSGFLVLPLATIIGLLTLAVYSFKGLGANIDQDSIRAIQLVGGVTIVTIAVLLDRRFRKYLFAPPALAIGESRDEKLLVSRFRAIAIGMFVVGCLLAILWHRIGM